MDIKKLIFLQNDAEVHLRINKNDLFQIKKSAKVFGVKYLSLIREILHDFAKKGPNEHRLRSLRIRKRRT